MNENKTLDSIIHEDDIKAFRCFMFELSRCDHQYFLRNDFLQLFDSLCLRGIDGVEFSKKSSLYKFFFKTQEIILFDNRAVFLYRREIAKYKVYVIYENSDHIEPLSVSAYLDMKDRMVLNVNTDPSQKVDIDFLSFYDYGPSINDSKKVGKGIDFLNNYMSGLFINNHEKFKKTLYEFLKLHSMNGQQLLINENIIKNEKDLSEALNEAIIWFDDKDHFHDMTTVEDKLNKLGFSSGFGTSEDVVRETMNLLFELLEEPNSKTLEKFIARIPMVSKIAIISPHGWFCQENVMGRPDTGGQVIYILDQVRALEKQLIEELESSGLFNIVPKIIVVTRLIPDNDGTTSNQRLEKIQDTQNAWILRVPFTNKDSHIVNHWISRFKIWNYLERFSLDVKKEIIGEFKGKPDLIIGNYSDGNLVASLLSQQLGVIQCNIAHALEKTKYLFSALYWKDLEHEYNFSMQFTADLISMNRANFIVTSTMQEIVGTKSTIGQYESYQFFTMPDLYKVTSGINLFHPKFNVIPPGIDQNIYFPYYKNELRVKHHTGSLSNMLFSDESEDIFGYLEDKGKIPVFAMSRLDNVKNIVGLVEAFAMDDALKSKANLIIIAGHVREDMTTDVEELNQIRRMYQLIDQYNLHGKIRWLGKFLLKHDTGEVYRIIADHKGVFVQPALFEAFGLTILEAMASGLPVFATMFGGPLEILQEKGCGFLINPTEPGLLSGAIIDFLTQVDDNPDVWEAVSKKAVKRVDEHYNWSLYAKQMIKLTKLYGFWKYHSSIKGKTNMVKYCELLFQLLFKKRAEILES